MGGRLGIMDREKDAGVWEGVLELLGAWAIAGREAEKRTKHWSLILLIS